MEQRTLIFILLVAILLALVIVRVVLSRRSDQQRSARVMEPPRTGATPARVQDRLVTKGEDRHEAARSGQDAAAALLHPLVSTSDDIEKPRGQIDPDAARKAHERGVPHLKGRENTQALAAFSEAIRLDPFYPNAYIGRALVYRRLGNIPAAVEDETRAEKLGGPEKTAWDRLVNDAHGRWQWDLDNSDWQLTDSLSRKAFLLRTLNRQILNGGLTQWIVNGYARWINDVIAAAGEVDTTATREVATTLVELAAFMNAAPRDDRGAEREAIEPSHEDEDPKVLDKVYECEDRFYQVQPQFVDDVEKWLEQRVTAQRKGSA
jgi:hypothetical protein